MVPVSPKIRIKAKAIADSRADYNYKPCESPSCVVPIFCNNLYFSVHT